MHLHAIQHVFKEAVSRWVMIAALPWRSVVRPHAYLLFTFLKDSSLSSLFYISLFPFPPSYLSSSSLSRFVTKRKLGIIFQVQRFNPISAWKKRNSFSTHTDVVIHAQKATVTMKNYKYFTTYTYTISLFTHTHQCFLQNSVFVNLTPIIGFNYILNKTIQVLFIKMLVIKTKVFFECLTLTTRYSMNFHTSNKSN